VSAWVFPMTCISTEGDLMLAPQNRPRFTLLLGIGLWGFAVLGEAAPKKARPFTPDEVAAVWVGISEDQNNLLRLTLDRQGVGIGAYSFVDAPPRVFSVSSWAYEPPRIVIEAQATHIGIKSVRGKIVGLLMYLSISGEGWKTDYTLRREAELEQRWRNLKKAMGEADVTGLLHWTVSDIAPSKSSSSGKEAAGSGSPSPPPRSSTRRAASSTR
jgi:hypothetical protein